MTIRQILAKKIYENSYLHFDLWSVIHFVGFFWLGTQYPNRIGLVILATIIFEVFEKIASKKTPFFKESSKDTFTDVIINVVGYIAGQNFSGF